MEYTATSNGLTIQSLAHIVSSWRAKTGATSIDLDNGCTLLVGFMKSEFRPLS
jgi:hypothetical protein